ncbi:MAG: DUF3618 domain-containing protein [Chloroflexota bacterium]|nr:DUF3618 domain-containing protein [Chloroflexota bacterium]
MTQDRIDEIRLSEHGALDTELRLDEDESLDTMSDKEQVEVAGIRADIEETRLEMGGTLNELGNRLEPSHLVEQAKENVREATIGRVEETAKGVSDMVMDTIKRNPIPTALAGAGLALLWKNRSQGQSQHDRSQREGYQYGTGYGYASRPASMYEADGGQGIGSKVGDAASTVGENVGGAVGAVAGGAQQATGEVIDRAGQTAQQVGWKLDSFMQASPLAMGAIAVGAGAVIGSLIPETPKEREVLGDASRQVTSAVRDTVDQATMKAEDTMDRVEEKVSSPA